MNEIQNSNNINTDTDDDIIEVSKGRKVFNIIKIIFKTIIIIAVILFVLAVALYTYENYCYTKAGIVTTMELEYTGAAYDLNNYDFVADTENFTYSFADSDTLEVADAGKHVLSLTVYKNKALFVKEKEYTVYVSIKDTTAPVFEVESPVTITVTRDCNLKKLTKYFPVTDTDDVSLYINTDTYDLSTIGTYNTQVVAIDTDGNTSFLDVIINVISPKITLKETECTLKVGQTITLTPHVTGKDKTVTWSSDDESIAIVDENGNVTGIDDGTTKITVSANGVSNSIACFVTGSATTTTTTAATTAAVTSITTQTTQSSSKSCNHTSSKVGCYGYKSDWYESEKERNNAAQEAYDNNLGAWEQYLIDNGGSLSDDVIQGYFDTNDWHTDILYYSCSLCGKAYGFSVQNITNENWNWLKNYLGEIG